MKSLRIIAVTLLGFSIVLPSIIAQAVELAQSSGDLITPAIEHTPVEKDISLHRQPDSLGVGAITGT